MKAIVQHRYGSPADLEVRDVARPVAGDDEVLVRVRAASIHPDVWHVVCGRPYVLRLMGAGLRRPKNPIPGTDLAGIVESVGKSVSRFAPGDAVFGETIATQQWKNGGAYAEYACAPQACLALKPDRISFEQAASVPASGFIALTNLRDRDRLGPGRTVLINGAGGGVGSLALQIVKAHGAHVTAVDSPGKLAMLRGLGADEVIDYTQEDFTRRGVRYDLIFDIPGDRPLSAFEPALKPDGRYVPIGHDRFGRAGRRVFGLIPHFLGLMFLTRFVKRLRDPDVPLPTRGEAMAVLRDFLEAGKITPVIDSTYRFDEVHAAFRHLVEDDTRGKVILIPDALEARYSIAKARPGDVAALPEIELAAARLLQGHAPESVLGEAKPLEDLRAAQASGLLWVALADDAPVGFALLESWSRDVVHLEEMDVHPRHGRRGVGTALIRAVLGWAAESGYRAMTLTTFRAVPWNMPFYARVGFEAVPALELGPELAAVVQRETARGLDPESRVVMRYRLA